MKFETGKHINVNGTSFRDTVDVPYAKLANIFGAPITDGCDKSLADWYIQFEDGTVATIYDWKNYGMKKEQINRWHIGGFNNRAVDLVKEVLSNDIR